MIAWRYQYRKCLPSRLGHYPSTGVHALSKEGHDPQEKQYRQQKNNSDLTTTRHFCDIESLERNERWFRTSRIPWITNGASTSLLHFFHLFLRTSATTIDEKGIILGAMHMHSYRMMELSPKTTRKRRTSCNQPIWHPGLFTRQWSWCQFVVMVMVSIREQLLSIGCFFSLHRGSRWSCC